MFVNFRCRMYCIYMYQSIQRVREFLNKEAMSQNSTKMSSGPSHVLGFSQTQGHKCWVTSRAVSGAFGETRISVAAVRFWGEAEASQTPSGTVAPVFGATAKRWQHTLLCLTLHVVTPSCHLVLCVIVEIRNRTCTG